jgi:hypothetical protein
MDDAATQLQQELDDAIRRALNIKRPVLTHANADTTWLIQLPYPPGLSFSGRLFYNILIDPWLDGPQSDVAGWFSTQWHAIKSSVRTISELDERLKEIESLAEEQVMKLNKRSRSDSQQSKPSTYIDAVAISHEFTDHCHKATLLELDPSVPVFATEKAANLIRSWNHFHQVYLPATFSARQLDWRETSKVSLPEWIGISRIVTDSDALYYHSALLFAFNLSGRSSPLVTGDHKDETAEAIIYSPHGINADDLSHLPRANPAISTLALMHGLHDVGITLTKQLNLGAYNGLRAQRICRARYWVGTHDEVKIGGGLLAPFLRRTVITIPEALEKEKAENRKLEKNSSLADMEGVNFAELRSGESLLLE